MLATLFVSLAIFSYQAQAQTDEINISAAFTNFIDLRVTGGASVEFNFTTITHYQQGIVNDNASSFEIASSTDFEVFASFTPFVSPDGDEVDQKNLTYLLVVPTARQSEEGNRWNFGTPQVDIRPKGTYKSWYHSGAYHADETEIKLLEPGSSGNAGSYEDNQFGIIWRLGYNPHTSKLGMPTMLDQNIAPGTYTTTLTLTAQALAL